MTSLMTSDMELKDSELKVLVLFMEHFLRLPKKERKCVYHQLGTMYPIIRETAPFIHERDIKETILTIETLTKVPQAPFVEFLKKNMITLTVLFFLATSYLYLTVFKMPILHVELAKLVQQDVKSSKGALDVKMAKHLEKVSRQELKAIESELKALLPSEEDVLESQIKQVKDTLYQTDADIMLYEKEKSIFLELKDHVGKEKFSYDIDPSVLSKLKQRFEFTIASMSTQYAASIEASAYSSQERPKIQPATSTQKLSTFAIVQKKDDNISQMRSRVEKVFPMENSQIHFIFYFQFYQNLALEADKDLHYSEEIKRTQEELLSVLLSRQTERSRQIQSLKRKKQQKQSVVHSTCENVKNVENYYQAFKKDTLFNYYGRPTIHHVFTYTEYQLISSSLLWISMFLSVFGIFSFRQIKRILYYDAVGVLGHTVTCVMLLLHHANTLTESKEIRLSVLLQIILKSTKFYNYIPSVLQPIVSHFLKHADPIYTTNWQDSFDTWIVVIAGILWGVNSLSVYFPYLFRWSLTGKTPHEQLSKKSIYYLMPHTTKKQIYHQLALRQASHRQQEKKNID